MKKFDSTMFYISGAVSEAASQAIESLLDFTYSGILRVNNDNMWLLHRVSQKLGISEACQLCEAFICETLSESSLFFFHIPTFFSIFFGIA